MCNLSLSNLRSSSMTRSTSPSYGKRRPICRETSCRGGFGRQPWVSETRDNAAAIVWVPLTFCWSRRIRIVRITSPTPARSLQRMGRRNTMCKTLPYFPGIWALRALPARCSAFPMVARSLHPHRRVPRDLAVPKTKLLPVRTPDPLLWSRMETDTHSLDIGQDRGATRSAPIHEVSPQWDVIIVAFATPDHKAPEGTLRFQIPPGIQPEEF